jgi:hypothetical protein
MKKKKNKKLPIIMTAALLVFCFSSCSEQWGQIDPPAGNQVYPRLELLLNLNFNEELNPEEIMIAAYDKGNLPAIVEDDSLGNVLHLDGGYARVSNPLVNVVIQNGVSFTFWTKQSEEDTKSALISFQKEDGSQKMFLTADGRIVFNGTDYSQQQGQTSLLPDEEWHYVAVAITYTGYSIYIDGEKAVGKTVPKETEPENPWEQLVQFMATAPYIYIGNGSGVEPKEWWIDDLKVYRNTITAKEQAKPVIGATADVFREFIIVGAEDFSTGWWSAFSDVVSTTGNGIIHFKFKNFNSGDMSNWNNWLVVITNGKAFGEEGYAEHAVMRADAYGWGSSNYSGANITSNYNWDTFVADMKGATVDLTLKTVDGRLEMTALTTTTSGKKYTYTYFQEGVRGEWGAFLTVERAYIEIDAKEVYTGTVYEKGKNLVGAADNSTGWWGAHSPLKSFDGNGAINYQFYNYGSGGANWNNWVLVLTNGIAIGSDGVAEYIVLRSDAYGWGTYYVGENITHNFNWDTFVADMQGAYVDLTIRRIDSRLDIIVKVTTAGGVTYNYSYFHNEFPTGPLGTCYTTDSSHLEFITISTYPFIK